MAKVSANDTTAGYLNGKLVAGANITLTENNDGADETLTVAAAGGGGATVYTDTYANEPAAGTAGDLFLPSNGAWLERDTGAAWAPWGPIFPMTKPVLGDFAWINQGASTASQTYGGIYMRKAGTGSAGVSLLKKTAPSVPYTIDMIFETTLALIQYTYVAILWRQSSDGKIITYGLTTDNNVWSLAVNKWSDASTWSATYVATKWSNSRLFMLRIADDNTNRVCSFSVNGQDWIQFHSVGRTDYLTADEVGFGISAGHATYGGQMNILSWVEG